GDVYLPCHDPDHGETIGIKFDHSKLFKHPLRSNLKDSKIANNYCWRILVFFYQKYNIKRKITKASIYTKLNIFTALIIVYKNASSSTAELSQGVIQRFLAV
ncbi:MAG: hypothetical protein V7L04_29025, partial [Nostoc sp.]|uniref:hypothetical protein n=1 Tax=Nostoc sp. TaxID=1180 RepID=UPI002FF68FA1